MSSPLRVVLVGQAPPPYGGQAIMIEQTLAGHYDGTELTFVRMAFARELRGSGRATVRKAAHLLGLVSRIAWARVRSNATVLYYPPAGPERVPMYRDIVVLLCTRWMFTSTIFHFHAGGVSEIYPDLPAWLRALYRKAYFRPDVAIRTAPSAPDDGRNLGAVREFVIPNGVQDAAADAPAAWFAARNAGTPRILFVGLLRESKGVLVLLDACVELAERGIRFELDLVGEFHSAAIEVEIRRRIQHGDLHAIVHHRGVLVGDAKHRAFAAASVFAFPSFFESETFGLVLVEAMQFGVPVVASAWRGIPSVVEDDVTGFLVPVRDSHALAERLALLLGDSDLRSRLGDAGRARYKSRYTLDQYRDRLQSVFDTLAERVA
ncbi:MAG: hypothetical protein QOE35_647 [Actinomycetota bacterium]|jgi:glycosyltransferase involved in cell wall biosynthesis